MQQVPDIQNVQHLHHEFVFVQSHELHDYWDIIRPGLLEVAKYGDAWIPEDVYNSLKAGTAHLHLIWNDGEDLLGFVVTTPVQDHKGISLHVWAIYSFGQNQSTHDAMHKQLEEWAAKMDAHRITFHSPRKGWERAAERYGFKPTQVIFEKKVN